MHIHAGTVTDLNVNCTSSWNLHLAKQCGMLWGTFESIREYRIESSGIVSPQRKIKDEAALFLPVSVFATRNNAIDFPPSKYSLCGRRKSFSFITPEKSITDRNTTRTSRENKWLFLKLKGVLHGQDTHFLQPDGCCQGIRFWQDDIQILFWALCSTSCDTLRTSLKTASVGITLGVWIQPKTRRMWESLNWEVSGIFSLRWSRSSLHLRLFVSATLSQQLTPT